MWKRCSVFLCPCSVPADGTAIDSLAPWGEWCSFSEIRHIFHVSHPQESHQLWASHGHALQTPGENLQGSCRSLQVIFLEADKNNTMSSTLYVVGFWKDCTQNNLWNCPRSAIHGRGLFCKRNIEAGEMVIEYAGNVIRAVLTDKREKYYDSKVRWHHLQHS